MGLPWGGFTYKNFNPQIIAGLFSIIIITTASIQNKFWESRTQKINEKVIEQNNLISSITDENNIVIEKYKITDKKLKKATSFIGELYSELKSSQNQLDKLKDKNLKK